MSVSVAAVATGAVTLFHCRRGEWPPQAAAEPVHSGGSRPFRQQLKLLTILLGMAACLCKSLLAAAALTLAGCVPLVWYVGVDYYDV